MSGKTAVITGGSSGIGLGAHGRRRHGGGTVMTSAHNDVLAVVDDYFAGIYNGDVERLAATFHPRAILGGEVKGQPYYKTAGDYLEGVRGRKSPSALGEPFAMRTISVEVQGEIALVKAQLRMLGFDYVDFLSLVRHDGRWVIVAKVFTHIDG